MHNVNTVMNKWKIVFIICRKKQSRIKEKAIPKPSPPDAARAWGERVKTTEQSLLGDSELKGNHDAQRLAH